MDRHLEKDTAAAAGTAMDRRDRPEPGSSVLRQRYDLVQRNWMARSSSEIPREIPRPAARAAHRRDGHAAGDAAAAGGVELEALIGRSSMRL